MARLHGEMPRFRGRPQWDFRNNKFKNIAVNGNDRLSLKFGFRNKRESQMIKIITAAVLVIGMASSAFAQSSTNSGASTGSDNSSKSSTEMNSGSPATSSDATTAPATGGQAGSSSAGTTEKCPAGTPGAGVKGAPATDTAAKGTNCK